MEKTGNLTIDHYSYDEKLIENYQSANTRNAIRAGKALGRLSNINLDFRFSEDLTDYKKENLLKDLDYVYKNINEIEL
jgi:hypothetical protein